MKTKKRKKATRLRGNNSHGHGARKKWKGSGHRGGFGMAGTGKRGDQKKTLVQKKYGNKYFGKQGITSKKVAKKKVLTINVGQIQKHFVALMKEFGKGEALHLSTYKILGDGTLTTKMVLHARACTPVAQEKIEKAGGNVVVLEKPHEKDKKVVEKE